MAISVQCQCGQQFQAKDQLAGKTVKCPRCQNALQIPTAAVDTATIPVSCDCGASLQAKPHMAGKMVKCPQCSQPIHIEVPQTPAPAEPKSAAQAHRPTAQPSAGSNVPVSQPSLANSNSVQPGVPPRKTRANLLPLLLVAGGVVVFGLFMAGGFALYRVFGRSEIAAPIASADATAGQPKGNNNEPHRETRPQLPPELETKPQPSNETKTNPQSASETGSPRPPAETETNPPPSSEADLRQAMQQPFEEVTFGLGPIDFVMEVPPGAESKNTNAAVKFLKRPGYELSVEWRRFDLGEFKSTAEKSADFVEAVVDQPDRYIYTHQHDGKTAYTFFILKEFGGGVIGITNHQALGRPTTKEQLDWLVKSADSLRFYENPHQPIDLLGEIAAKSDSWKNLRKGRGGWRKDGDLYRLLGVAGGGADFGWMYELPEGCQAFDVRMEFKLSPTGAIKLSLNRDVEVVSGVGALISYKPQWTKGLSVGNLTKKDLKTKSIGRLNNNWYGLTMIVRPNLIWIVLEDPEKTHASVAWRGEFTPECFSLGGDDYKGWAVRKLQFRMRAPFPSSSQKSTPSQAQPSEEPNIVSRPEPSSRPGRPPTEVRMTAEDFSQKVLVDSSTLFGYVHSRETWVELTGKVVYVKHFEKDQYTEVWLAADSNANQQGRIYFSFYFADLLKERIRYGDRVVMDGKFGYEAGRSYRLNYARLIRKLPPDPETSPRPEVVTAVEALQKAGVLDAEYLQFHSDDVTEDGRIKPELLKHLKHLGELDYLKFNSTALTNAGFAQLPADLPVRWADIEDKQEGRSTALRHVAGWKQLRILHLNRNGENPDDNELAPLKDLKDLRILTLLYPTYGNRALAHVGRISSLELLTVANAKFSAGSLTQLEGLKNLRDVSIQNTPIGDASLAVVAQWPQLRELSIRNAKITDAGIEHLKAAKELRQLVLNGNDIGDGAMSQLARMPNLRRLLLDDTNVTDSGLVQLEKSTSLSELRLPSTTTVAGREKLRNSKPDLTVYPD